MSFLFVGSTGDRAGHSLVTWALARELMAKGLKVGFLKPFGSHPIHSNGLWIDRDAYLFKEVLGLEETYEQICPFIFGDESWGQKAVEEILRDLKGITRKLGEGKDVLLIMGSRQIFFDDAPFPLPDVSIIPELKANVVLVNRLRTVSKSLYSILSLISLLRDSVKGIILNRVPPELVQEIRTRVIPSLSQKGVSVTAAISEDPFLSYRSIREIREVLKGEILCGEEYIENPVGGMTVGSGDLTGELRIFKRAYNKVVLLSASQPGEALTDPSRPRPVAGILLTGDRRPAPQLLQAAENASLPLIRTREDTFASLGLLEQTTPPLSPKDEPKVRHFSNLLNRDGAIDTLIASLDVL